MSLQLIDDYYLNVEKIKQYGGTKKELSIKSAFANLLNSYCKTKNLLLIQELEYKTQAGNRIIPDGTVKDALRLDWGFWESKDEYDNLNKEIKEKIRKGYPIFNIIFEDSKKAVLIQEGKKVQQSPLDSPTKLDLLLKKFLEYERPEINDFHKAIEKFKEDIPTVLNTLRELIEKQGKINNNFIKARNRLLNICQQTINPNLTVLDIREMLIQHILTEDIFITIFNESQFHRENNIAIELEKVTSTFFTGKIKKETLGLIEHYYFAIRSAAACVYNHNEKQKFLKVIYENFYKVYNPKGADRLGIFYTPNEIVQFMVKTTNDLSFIHFKKLLSDENVEILDPATGTGTFITEIIENIPKSKIEYKYINEIHCNEVAILPYYIANLNIEFTYKQKTEKYEPFNNICFVDTLDNTGFNIKNKQTKLFDIGTENYERIKNQNKKKISIIIGNPPYNANQLNENENNKNKDYPIIDKRIKETYVKYSKAQKTKVYDMYSRFYRWATDRLNENGIIAFITNRSFIDSITFDGFRKCIQEEFNYVYIIDTKSDVRANPKISGTSHNVFGIQTGVAVVFLVKIEKEKRPCYIQYFALKDEQAKNEKLLWFGTTSFDKIEFNHLEPDERNNWLSIPENDFYKNIPLVKEGEIKNAVFNTYSLGISTNRDEWVTDFNRDNLKGKIKYFIKSYNQQLKSIKKVNKEDINDKINYDIKWSSRLKSLFIRGKKIRYKDTHIIKLHYRPFIEKNYYSDKMLSDRLTSNHYNYFGKKLVNDNKIICFPGIGSNKKFSTLVSDKIWSLDLIEKTQGVPLYVYKGRNKIENVTFWGLNEFRSHYKDINIEKEDIFNYIYAVLNNKKYIVKYEKNLKRELPRVPFYDNFWTWSKLGKKLIEIHLNIYKIKCDSIKMEEKKLKKNEEIKDILRYDHKLNKIILDNKTSMLNIPEDGKTYKIRERTVIEWVLDQYKVKKYKSDTLQSKYNNYKYIEYKDDIIELLMKVITLSVETNKINKKF